MGDSDRHVLDRLTDSAWRERSDKLTLLQSYDDFQRLWGLYQIFPTLSTIRKAAAPPSSLIDAVLDSLDDVLTSIGPSAGVSWQFLDQMKEGNRIVRTTVDLSKEEQIGAWQRNVIGQYLVLPVAGGLGITAEGDTVLFKQPPPTFSENATVRTVPNRSTLLGVPAVSSRSRQLTGAPRESPILVGLPVALKITEETAADYGLQTFLTENADFDFVLVSFALSFIPGRLKHGVFKSVDVSIELSSTSGPSGYVPVAWSMAPTTAFTDTEFSSTVQIQVADMKFREPIMAKSRPRSEQYIVATGEGTSNPRWHLWPTPGRAIQGLQRLQLVIQIPKESHARARIACSARTGRWWLTETLQNETAFELPA